MVSPLLDNSSVAVEGDYQYRLDICLVEQALTSLSANGTFICIAKTRLLLLVDNPISPPKHGFTARQNIVPIDHTFQEQYARTMQHASHSNVSAQMYTFDSKSNGNSIFKLLTTKSWCGNLMKSLSRQVCIACAVGIIATSPIT